VCSRIAQNSAIRRRCSVDQQLLGHGSQLGGRNERDLQSPALCGRLGKVNHAPDNMPMHGPISAPGYGLS
jgi:hypothetical protein